MESGLLSAGMEWGKGEAEMMEEVRVLAPPEHCIVCVLCLCVAEDYFSWFSVVIAYAF